MILKSNMYKLSPQRSRTSTNAGSEVNRANGPGHMHQGAAIKTHHHLLIRAHVARPIRNPAHGKRWALGLVKAIGMEPLTSPTAAYCRLVGNRGLTIVLPITTSHVAAHFWDEISPALLQLDVYSCAPLAPSLVIDFLAPLLPVDFKFKFLDRSRGFRCLPLAATTKAR